MRMLHRESLAVVKNNRLLPAGVFYPTKTLMPQRGFLLQKQATYSRDPDTSRFQPLESQDATNAKFHSQNFTDPAIISTTNVSSMKRNYLTMFKSIKSSRALLPMAYV